MFSKLANKVTAVVTGLGTALVAGAAFATPSTPIEDLFGAVDISGVSDLVLGLATAIVSIALIYAGIRLVKRAVSAI